MDDFKAFINSYVQFNYIDYLEYNELIHGSSSDNIQQNEKNKITTTTTTTTTTNTNTELKSHASKKDIPKVQEFVSLSRDYSHQFTRKDKIYKDSLLYAYSKPNIIDEIKDEEYIKDQSEFAKLNYVGDTISKYRQLFGYPQNEMKFRNELVNDAEVKRLKNHIIKSLNITKLHNSDNYSALYNIRSGYVERGYLSILARYSLFKNNTLSNNISLHFPFTYIEKLILKNSNINETSSLKDLYYVSRELPGRAPVDIIRFIKDENICKKNQDFKKLDVLLRDHVKETNIFIKDLDSNKDVKEDFGITKTIYTDKKSEVLDVNQILLSNEIGRVKGQSTIRSDERKLVKHFTKNFSKITTLSNGGTQFKSVLDVKFDPTGYTNKIMALSKGKGIDKGVSILYDYKTQVVQTLVFHEKQCNEGHFSIDGSKVITCSKDGRVATWSTETADLLGYYEHEDRSPCFRLNLHRSNELAVCGFKDKKIVLYNYGTDVYYNLNTNQDLDLWPSAVTDLSFGYGKNSEYVAAGIGSNTDEPVKGFVTVIDSNRPDEYLNLFVQEKDVSSIAWNPKLHDCLASASNDPERSICIYDLRDIDPVALTMKTNQEDVNICCYSPCGNYITISGTPNYTYVFDTRNCNKPIRELRHKINQDIAFNAEPKLVTHAQWSRNAEFFATAADDGTVRLWDIENDKQLIALEHAPFPGTGINYFDISINSDLIVSGGDDGKICIFGCV